jgi:hypothetical protein
LQAEQAVAEIEQEVEVLVVLDNLIQIQLQVEHLFQLQVIQFLLVAEVVEQEWKAEVLLEELVLL